MIINNIAKIYNESIINLYNNGISFYQVIVGLFIFNVIIYSLCKLLKIGTKIYYN